MADSAAAAPRLRPTALALARSIPALGWVGGLVVFSAVVRYAFARRMPAPWIMVDELVYSELAKSFAATGHFLVRDEPGGSYGVVYPLLISPAYRLFESVPDAYAAAKAINAVLISLTAVPAYLLARRVLPAGLAVAGSVLTVAVPSMLYAGTLMTENVFYPLFVTVALVLVLVLERPTAPRQLALLAICGLAFATRAQALALLPAVVTAPLLLAWWDRRGGRSLASYRLLWSVVGGALVTAVAVQLIRGRSPRALLGAYETVGHQHYSVPAVVRWLLYHVAELDLYLGVLPFAGLLLLVVCARRLDPPVRIFLAAAVPLVAWLVLEVAAFASLPTVDRVEERNMFYVAPLFLIALLAWIDRGLPRPRAAAAIAAVVSAGLLALLPYTKLIGVQVQSDTLALLPWWWIQDHWITLQQVWIAALAVGAVLAAAFVLVPVRYAVVLPVVVLAWFLISFAAIENGRHGARMASLGALFEGITTGHRDWVDAAVGPKPEVAFVWSGQAKPFSLWQNEFFSRSVGPVYELANPLGGGLPATPVRVDRRDGALRTPGGSHVRAAYALTDVSLPLAGRVVARDLKKGMVLLRTGGELREVQLLTGIYPGDTWSGARATYTRLRCNGGAVDVRLASDPHLHRGIQTVVARSAGRVVRGRVLPAAVEPLTMHVPLRRSAGARCTVAFEISPTAVPARVLPGSTDRRRLGVHFLAFDYRPPARRSPPPAAIHAFGTDPAQTRASALASFSSGVAADPLGVVGERSRPRGVAGSAAVPDLVAAAVSPGND